MIRPFLFLAAIGLAAQAPAAIVSFTGTRQNANPLLPPGSGRCAPTYFNTVVIGPDNGTSTGLSNFGAFTSSQSHCIVSAPPTAIVDGLFTYTFASGSTLFGTYTGQVVTTATPGTFASTENLIVTGGTGLFLGATGTITTNGQLAFVAGSGVYSGTISGSLNAPAVPEPASWALMIGGFGTAGAVQRRRSRLVAAA